MKYTELTNNSHLMGLLANKDIEIERLKNLINNPSVHITRTAYLKRGQAIWEAQLSLADGGVIRGEYVVDLCLSETELKRFLSYVEKSLILELFKKYSESAIITSRVYAR